MGENSRRFFLLLLWRRALPPRCYNSLGRSSVGSPSPQTVYYVGQGWCIQRARSALPLCTVRVPIASDRAPASSSSSSPLFLAFLSFASSTGCFLSEGKDKRLVEIRRNFYLGGVNGNQVHRFIYRVFFLSEGKDKRLVEIRRNFHLGGVNGNQVHRFIYRVFFKRRKG